MNDAECVRCGVWIDSGDDYYTDDNGDYWCVDCVEELEGLE